MPDTPGPTAEHAGGADPGWPIAIRPDGRIIYDGIVVGGLDFTNETMYGEPVPRLSLNLGWLRAAGVGLRLHADPEVGDRHRNGIAFERLP